MRWSHLSENFWHKMEISLHEIAHHAFRRDPASWVRIRLASLNAVPRRFPEDFHEGRSRSFRQLHEDVATCMRTGTWREDDPLETTLSLWAHAHGLVSLHRVGRFESDASFRAIYDRAMHRFLAGLSR